MTQIPDILPSQTNVPNGGWTKDAVVDYINENSPIYSNRGYMGEFDLTQPGGGGGFSQGGDFQGEYEGGGFENMQPDASTEQGGAYVDEEEENRRKYYEGLQDEEQGSTGNKWLLWAAIGVAVYAILKR